MKKIKDLIAIDKGYSSWEDMENFIINNNSSVVVAQLLVSAMEDVCLKMVEISVNETLKTAMQ